MTPSTVTDSMIIEAILFTAKEPLTIAEIADRAPQIDVKAALIELADAYQDRSLSLFDTGHGWTIRTKPEYSDLCRKLLPAPLRLTRAAMETLAVIAYFQPVTRSEIETIRGVSLGKGTMDALVWSGLVKPGPRRQTPGSPMTFLTTDAFLERFDLAGLVDLPNLDQIKGTMSILDSAYPSSDVEHTDGVRDEPLRTAT